MSKGDLPPKEVPAFRTPRYDPTLNEISKSLEIAEKTQAHPEVIAGLKRALEYAALRNAYTLQCTTEQSDACRKIVELTNTHPWDELKEQGKTIWNLRPGMMTGPLEGQFLKSLVSAQRARRVLDVGMYTGYSALAMAEALPADGEVVTLDIDSYLRDLNLQSFSASPHGSKIQIRIGRAIDSMKEMADKGEKFDFIFLDADKSEYIDYLKLAFDGGLLAENGTIAVDNAFRGGNNYLPSDNPPDASRLFGEYVIADIRLHKVLVPIRDGVLLIRRLSEVNRDSLRS